jgi:hypothetical protein
MNQFTSSIQSGAGRAPAVGQQPAGQSQAREAAVESKNGSAPAARISISKDAQRVSAIKEYVRQLFEQQGIELKGGLWDDMTVEDGQAAIAEGGEWSAEAVADRIINFVSEISGSNPELKERLQEAVRQGFEEARQAFGGWLPEVSERTYDLVMERFDEAFESPAAVQQ